LLQALEKGSVKTDECPFVQRS